MKVPFELRSNVSEQESWRAEATFSFYDDYSQFTLDRQLTQQTYRLCHVWWMYGSTGVQSYPEGAGVGAGFGFTPAIRHLMQLIN